MHQQALAQRIYEIQHLQHTIAVRIRQRCLQSGEARLIVLIKVELLGAELRVFDVDFAIAFRNHFDVVALGMAVGRCDALAMMRIGRRVLVVDDVRTLIATRSPGIGRVADGALHFHVGQDFGIVGFHATVSAQGGWT